MKLRHIALIAALLVPLAGSAVADATTNYFGTSSTSAYTSAFSTQASKASKSRGNKSFGSFGARPRPAKPVRDSSAVRRNDSSAARSNESAARSNDSNDSASNSASNRRDSTVAAPKRGGFGSFGAGAAAAGAGVAAGAATAAPDERNNSSAMSRDLERSQQQANARKTLDEREASVNALPPLNNRVPGQGGQSPNYGQQGQQPQPGYNQQSQPYNQQQQPPVVVQQSDGIGKMLMGFMLGRAMSSSGGNHTYYPGNGNGNGASQGQAMPAGTAQMPAQPQSSFFGSMLRIFAWLLVLGVIGWAVYFGLRFFKRGKVASRANYSFERE